MARAAAAELRGLGEPPVQPARELVRRAGDERAREPRGEGRARAGVGGQRASVEEDARRAVRRRLDAVRRVLVAQHAAHEAFGI
ncbi:MAG: hypothetical protein MUC64_13770, partial [Rubritepida sp.]|nr:hypothetical protein [Rubritepida sp.]